MRPGHVISCRTLGPVQVLVDGGPAPAELLWRKNLALLVYLARSPKRARTRDHLIGLLWADKEERAARQSLREAVRVLKHHLGETGLDVAGDQVALSVDAAVLDVDRFAELAERGEWTAAAQLVGGEFLEGFSVPHASGFEDWLASERLAWRRRSVEALARCAEDRLRAGDGGAATELGLRGLELDPLSEPALRVAMRSLALAGDRAGALARYQAFLDRLKTSAGAEPAAELAALAERVRRERTWRVPEYLAPQRAVGAESRRAPLVGREAQLQELLRVWSGVRSRGRAAATIVAGDPGSGKTRLLEEVLARGRLEGAAVTTMTAVPGDREQAGNGLLGLARGGLLETAGIAAAQPAALAALAAELPEWGDRFGKQVRGVRAQPLARAVSEVIRAAAEEQPVLLGVDDAQFLDPPSLDALAGLARDLAAQPLCLVLTSVRPGDPPELDALWSHLGRDVGGVSVGLEPLDAEAMQRLARWALPSYNEADLERVSRRVGADSAGLPLLAVELLHAVAVGMDLGTISGAWPQPLRTLSQTLPGDLPGAVVAAIRVGFRRLSEPAQRALAAAAVLGERETAGRIGRATGLEPDALHAALDELEWQRWLAADPRGYAFLARIVRDVVARDLVAPGQRRRLQEAAEGTS